MAATSVGKVGGEVLLDLNYEEDSKAEVDMNVVKTGRGRFVEIQGTAEDAPFSDEELHGAHGRRRQGHPGADRDPAKVLGDVTLREVKKEKP